jgi:hypothetical protein
MIKWTAIVLLGLGALGIAAIAAHETARNIAGREGGDTTFAGQTCSYCHRR